MQHAIKVEIVTTRENACEHQNDSIFHQKTSVLW